MRQRNYRAWPAELVTLMVLAMALALLHPSVLRHALPEPATRFLAYYEATGKTAIGDRMWDRIAYSLLLSAGDAKTGQKPTRR